MTNEERLELALRNCYAFARKDRFKNDTDWGQIRRFCEEGGLSPQLLRQNVAEPPPVDRSKQCTTDGRTPLEVRQEQQQDPETGQHKSYVVLCEEERAKGFVRPVRTTYIHVGPGGHEIDPTNPAKHGRTGSGCGVATTMGRALAETYARDPGFYSSTFCAGCNKHLPVAEFVWEDGSVLGT